MQVNPRVIVLMGVSGAGKTTLGLRTAKHLGVEFVEGDAYHSAASIAKMRAGTPLQDEDRWPWLEAVGKAALAAANRHGCAVVACSALKERYREALRRAVGEPILFLVLQADRQVLEGHLSARSHDYMPASLLESQLSLLEPLSSQDMGALISVACDADTSFRAILEALEPSATLRSEALR